MFAIYVWNCCTGADDSNFRCLTTVHLLSVLFILVATVHLLNSINFGCNWGVNGSIHFGCNWGVNGCELCEAGRYEVGEA